MKYSLIRVVCLVFVLLSFVSAQLYADGMIFPMEPGNEEIHRRMIFTPPRMIQDSFTVPLSVTRHRVKVAIKDLAAVTNVDQAFYNHENRVIEGLYIFPLPVGASLSGFSMDVEGKMTKGELLDAEKARSIYENIVRQMRDPGLLEYMGTGLFKTRIYPIEPLKNKDVKIEYQEALTMEGNLVRYVYPLNIEKFLQEPMKDVSIEIKLESKTPITTIYSPTHSVSIHRSGEYSATVGFEADSVRPEKDFVLYYAVSKKDLSMSVLCNRSDPTEDGTFMLMLSPRAKEQEESLSKIDLALVLDTSGSMSGQRIQQAKKALEFCINSLKDENRLFLVSFSTEAESYKPDMIEMNSDVRVGAGEYVKKMDAMGGTNISEALLKALKALNKNDDKRPMFIVFVTDGKPTAGLTETDEILREVKKANEKNVRIFSLGIGDQLNAPLIDRIAEENGGTSDYISESEDIEIKISNLFSKLTHPVMTDVSVEFRNIDVVQVYPRQIPDVFKDANIMLLGRYTKPGEALITLTGSVAGNPVKMDFETSFPRVETENGFVGRIWAARKIGFLLDQIRKSGSDEELKSEIVMLAKRYGILTPYTSFLVVEDSEQSGPNLRKAMVPESSDAVRFQAFEEDKAAFSVDRLESQADGDFAVGAAREMNAMKSAAMPAAPGRALSGGGFSGRARVRRESINQPVSREVDDRTFYLIDEKWFDSTVKTETPDVVVKAYSDAYFELLRKDARIARFAALGGRVVFAFEGRTWEIDPDKGITASADLK